MLTRRGQKSLNGFKFVTFIGRFPNDGVSSMAVKMLKLEREACSKKVSVTPRLVANAWLGYGLRCYKSDTASLLNNKDGGLHCASFGYGSLIIDNLYNYMCSHTTGMYSFQDFARSVRPSHTQTHRYTDTQSHTLINRHTRAHTHARARAHKRTHARTHTHTNTRARERAYTNKQIRGHKRRKKNETVTQ